MFGQSLLSAFGIACTTDTDQLFNPTSTQINSTATYQLNSGGTSIPSNTYPLTTRGITYAAGKFGNASTFSGGTNTNASTGSQMYVSNSIWGSTRSTFSVSLWFKGSTSPGEIPLIGNGGTIGGTTGFMVYTTTNGNLNGTFMTSGGGMYFGNTTNICDNQWHKTSEMGPLGTQRIHT